MSLKSEVSSLRVRVPHKVRSGDKKGLKELKDQIAQKENEINALLENFTRCGQL